MVVECDEVFVIVGRGRGSSWDGLEEVGEVVEGDVVCRLYGIGGDKRFVVVKG